MRIKNLFLISAVLAFMFAFTACDDDDNSNNDNLCGNGVIDTGEECDGSNLNETTCSILDSNTTGTLQCDATCHFDTTQCISPECGNGIVEGDEECDGTNVPVTSCTAYDATRFTDGDLSCNTATCTYNTSQCTENQTCLHGNFFESANPEQCDLMGGTDECCDLNGMPSTCFNFGNNKAYCLQTCTTGPDCGWSMGCNSNLGNLCYLPFCGAQTANPDLSAPCNIDGTRSGWCYPIWNAMDETGVCFQNGTQQHGEACVRDDNNDPMGQLDVDPATQCDKGICLANTNVTDGHCVNYCNPVAVYDAAAANDATDTWNTVDTCPANYNCINFSSIDIEDTNADGSPNSSFLFREADYGICYPATDGVDDVITKGLLSCDLISGRQIKSGEACPTDTTCQIVAYGNLIGACLPVANPASSIGDICEIPDATSTDPAPCEAGSVCAIADPLNDPAYNDPNSTADPVYKCVKLCDADRNAADDTNEACDATGEICLTTSRLFTVDHELPVNSDGDVETSPSRLAFCVPTSDATN